VASREEVQRGAAKAKAARRPEPAQAADERVEAENAPSTTRRTR